jgi:hypothetical protein
VQNADPSFTGQVLVSINADVNGYNWTLTSDGGSDIGFGQGLYGENDS